MKQKTTEDLVEDQSGLLMLISSKSFNTGEIPKAWKKDDVMPVFKKSECGRMGGYKSVSLIRVFVKTGEQSTADWNMWEGEKCNC